MGWFDGIFGGGSGSDPLSDLDPKVREFLQKESPVKFQPAASLATAEKQSQDGRDRPPAPPASLSASSGPTHDQFSQTSQTNQISQISQGHEGGTTAASASGTPDKSLFQDGRYAHLWKTYRPLREIENETKTDNDRLMDVLDGFKERRVQIGRAALENCALEQIDWNQCIKTGPLTSRMTMCNAEMKKFERCYNMQSRLLKALGYLSTQDRAPEVDEQIQVHADTLYHRMLDQEAAIEKAKAEGRPVPAPNMAGQLPVPIRSPAAAAAGTGTPLPDLADLPEDVRKNIADKLAKLPESDRPAEEAALRAEVAAQTELADRMTKLRELQAAERAQRKAEGKATIKDHVQGLFGK